MLKYQCKCPRRAQKYIVEIDAKNQLYDETRETDETPVCPVCLEICDVKNGIVPVTIVDCKHKLCQACMFRICQKDPFAVTCPYCRKPITDLTNGIDWNRANGVPADLDAFLQNPQRPPPGVDDLQAVQQRLRQWNREHSQLVAARDPNPFLRPPVFFGREEYWNAQEVQHNFAAVMGNVMAHNNQCNIPTDAVMNQATFSIGGMGQGTVYTPLVHNHHTDAFYGFDRHTLHVEVIVKTIEEIQKLWTARVWDTFQVTENPLYYDTSSFVENRDWYFLQDPHTDFVLEVAFHTRNPEPPGNTTEIYRERKAYVKFNFRTDSGKPKNARLADLNVATINWATGTSPSFGDPVICRFAGAIPMRLGSNSCIYTTPEVCLRQRAQNASAFQGTAYAFGGKMSGVQYKKPMTRYGKFGENHLPVCNLLSN